MGLDVSVTRLAMVRRLMGGSCEDRILSWEDCEPRNSGCAVRLSRAMPLHQASCGSAQWASQLAFEP